MPKTWSSWMLGVMSSFALRLLGRRTPDMLRVSSRGTAVCRRSWSTSFLQWSSRLFQILAGCSPEHFAHPRQCSEAEVFTRSVPWCCPGLLPGYPGRGPMSISLSVSLISAFCLRRGRGTSTSDRPRRFGSYACSNSFWVMVPWFATAELRRRPGRKWRSRRAWLASPRLSYDPT